MTGYWDADRALFLSSTKGIDAKRLNAWREYGFKDNLEFADYYAAWSRHSAGCAVVSRLVERCWADFPRIRPLNSEEGAVTPWEKTVSDWFTERRFEALVEWDRRNLVGHYAGLILEIGDGLPLDQPRGAGIVTNLLPVWESQLRPSAYDQLTGEVTLYQYLQRPDQEVQQTVGQPNNWANIHPSRVLISAEGSAGGGLFDGVPLLRAGFNNLVNLEKIEGGSGESYLKNASRQLAVEFSDAVNVAANLRDENGQKVDIRKVVTDQVRSLNRYSDSAIVLQGGKAMPLQAQMIDPESPWTINANALAASVQMPFTIIFGQQTGRLASDQDQVDMNTRCMQRRNRYLSLRLADLLDVLIATKTIPPMEYIIEWSDLLSTSDEDKLSLAEKMANINANAFKYGEGPVFTPEEIRRAAGYKQA